MYMHIEASIEVDVVGVGNGSLVSFNSVVRQVSKVTVCDTRKLNDVSNGFLSQY